MSRPGTNTAVTQGGHKYNKLKRPDNYLASLTPSAKAAGNMNDKWQHDLHDLNDLDEPAPAETSKRSHDDADLSDDGVGKEGHKRSRAEHVPETRKKVNNRSTKRPVDNSYGMHSMFPGILDAASDSDEDYDTMEALAYLKSVRSEAESIPTLLVAPRKDEEGSHDRSMCGDGEEDYGVEFIDGTWIARDPIPAETSTDASVLTEDLDGQEQYYRKLLWRYEGMRKSLNGQTTANSAAEAKPDSSKTMAAEIPKRRHDWLYILDRQYPTPSLLRKMNDGDVFAGLKYCVHSLDRFNTITKQKSCWIWALLAKAPEEMTLDYVKVGCIRDLGHKAGVLGSKLRRAAQQVVEDEYEEDEEMEDWIVDGDNAELIPKPNNGSDAQSDAEMSMSDDEGEIHEDDKSTVLEQARARLIAQLGDRLVQTLGHTPTTIDVIIQKESPERECKQVPKSETLRTMVADDQTKRLEDARARLLAQLDDPTPSTPEVSTPRQVFGSRAEAEHHRVQQLHEPSVVKENPQAEGQDIPTTETFAATEAATVSAQPPPRRVNEHVEELDLNTTVTIDMILTVVAERYGQKDLLRFRDVWL